MSERDAVERTQTLPATVQSLADDFCAQGVVYGSILIVHASLGSLAGCPDTCVSALCRQWSRCKEDRQGETLAVIEALKIAVGPSGMIVMPAHSSDLSDPSGWSNPPVPRSWWPIIRDAMPAFDPQMTPTRGMGTIAECFRTLPGVMRSNHPHVSFAAYGPCAAEIVADHPLQDRLGDYSPLGRLYSLGSWVLLIGVGHDRNTSLYLSEIRAFRQNVPQIKTGAPILIEGRRRGWGVDPFFRTWDRKRRHCDVPKSDVGVMRDQQSRTSWQIIRFQSLKVPSSRLWLSD